MISRVMCYNWDTFPDTQTGPATLQTPRSMTHRRLIPVSIPDCTPVDQGVKTCTKCGEAKARSEFYRYRAQCKPCMSAINRVYRAANLDRLREHDRQRAELPHRREAKLQWCRNTVARRVAQNKQRYWSDPERWRERSRLNHAKWRSTERGRLMHCLTSHRRRARARSASGECTTEQLIARWNYYGGLCWMCGAAANTFDHVIAIALGGSQWPANLRPACKSCNSGKRDRHWKEWKRS